MEVNTPIFFLLNSSNILSYSEILLIFLTGFIKSDLRRQKANQQAEVQTVREMAADVQENILKERKL
ncbi:hypothetical protein XENORESO_016215 [Xenotaenia resolanae]|uniref:Uncharacterized protein n=1 Tax=Xenotaenia resolanae TaxID=208358 RepID=A0ABV0X534_9TELE